MKRHSKRLVITGIILLFIWGCNGSTDSDISREMILTGTNGKYWSDVKLLSDSVLGTGNRIFLKHDKTATIQYIRIMWSGQWELLNDGKQLHFFRLVNQQRESLRIYDILELSLEEMKLRLIDSTTIEIYQAEK